MAPADLDFLSRVSAAESRDCKAALRQKSAPKHAKPPNGSTSQKAARPPSPQRKKPSPPKKKARAASPSAAHAAALKLSPGAAKSKVAASNRIAFVATQKESFSVTNQPKLKYGNVAKDLQHFGFKVLGPIAAGAFSTIVRARHAGHGEVAVKTFASCVGKQAEDHQRELEVLRMVSSGEPHPHVAALLHEYTSPQGATHAVLVYCGGGSLNMKLGKLRRSRDVMPAAEASFILAAVVSGLSYLHSLGVAHRDIKPANVLHDGERWRLCDFGFALCCGDQRLREVLGTPAYSAPELLSHQAYVGEHVDMWATGVMLFEMLCGSLPFAARGTATDLTLRVKNGFGVAIKSGAASWPEHVPSDARALVGALLAKVPEHRPSASEVRQHKWVTAHVSATGEPLRDESPDSCDEHATQRIEWWCDVAAEGCLRPTAPTGEQQQYDPAHRCWHYGGTYMVCEPCYRSGHAAHHDELQLVSDGGNLIGRNYMSLHMSPLGQSESHDT